MKREKVSKEEVELWITKARESLNDAIYLLIYMVRKNVLKIINLYKKDLEKKVKVDKIIVFGSCAKGVTHQNSDIDLLIISSQFSSFDADDRAKILCLARENPKTWDMAMDIFGVTPEEYKSASRLSILGEIKKTGIMLS